MHIVQDREKGGTQHIGTCKQSVAVPSQYRFGQDNLQTNKGLYCVQNRINLAGRESQIDKFMVGVFPVGGVDGAAVPDAAPHGRKGVKDGNKGQGSRKGKSNPRGSTAMVTAQKGHQGNKKAQELAPRVAHKNFRPGEGCVKDKKAPNSRHEEQAEGYRLYVPKVGVDEGIGNQNDARKPPCKAIDPIYEIYCIDDPYNPNDREYVTPKAQIKLSRPPRKAYGFKSVPRYHHKDCRHKLYQCLVAGPQGLKIVPDAKDDDKHHGGEDQNKRPSYLFFPDAGKGKYNDNNKIGRNKRDAAQPGNLPRMDLPFINMIIPGKPVGRLDDQVHHRCRKEEG